jgi:hypothetical protein
LHEPPTCLCDSKGARKAASLLSLQRAGPRCCTAPRVANFPQDFQSVVADSIVVEHPSHAAGSIVIDEIEAAIWAIKQSSESGCGAEAACGTRAELRLAFWASIGFKPGGFMTIGINEKRAAWLCRVFARVTHPA